MPTRCVEVRESDGVEGVGFDVEAEVKGVRLTSISEQIVLDLL